MYVFLLFPRLSVNSFNQEASKAVLDLTGDTDDALKKKGRAKMIWDKKKKKMVGISSDDKVKKIRSESGAWIPATYRSGRYDQWVAKTKADAEEDSEQSDCDEDTKFKRKLFLKAFHFLYFLVILPKLCFIILL